MLFKKPSGPIDWLIVGLGNPGKQYEGTRHNAGFMAVEALSQVLNARINKVRFKSLCGEAVIGNQKVLLMMPQTFMNLSGQAVVEAMHFYKLPPERCLIIHDDISLPVGALRIRRKGSDGGQKGLQNILYLSGSDQFPRIKMGVGAKPHPEYDLAAWVLSRFSAEDAKKMVEAAEHAAAAAQLIVTESIDTAMNRYST